MEGGRIAVVSAANYYTGATNVYGGTGTVFGASGTVVFGTIMGTVYTMH